MDGVLLIALALAGGAALALAPIPTALTAMAVAWLLGRRVSAWILLLAALGLLVNGIRSRAALARANEAYARTAEFLSPPARCEGEAVVIASPVVIRRDGASGSVPARDGSDGSDGIDSDGRVDVELISGHCGERQIQTQNPIRARIYGAPVDLARGDRLALLVDLSPVHLFRNEGLRDPTPSIARSGTTASGGAVDARVIARGTSIAALVDRARGHARRRIEATFHPEAAPLARALVLGETNLDPLDDEAFRASGLSHLLAVSGTHLVLAVAGFAAALRALLVRVEPLAARLEVGRVSAAVSIPAAWLYADFAGGGGSALRAAGMLTAGMLAHALGRRSSGKRAFAWSILVPALLDPLSICDLSFSLSTGATAGLLALNRPISDGIVRGPQIVRKLLAPVATTLAAMLGCAPLVASASPSFPLLGIAANIVAAPVGEVAALPICLLHAVLFWAPPVEQGAATLGSGALLIVRAIARFTAAQGAVLPIPPPTALQLAALVIAAAAAWLAEERRRRITALLVGAAAWLALEVQAVRAGAPRGKLRVSVLDVGQGDSVLVDLPEGGSMLIDGGGFVGSPVDTGARVILPLLRARRRSSLDVVVLSHPHPDHFGGLVSTAQSVAVGELWDTGQGEDLGAGPAYASLLAGLRARKVPIRRPSELCGAPRVLSGARVEILSPCPAFHPDASANDNSLVLRVSYGRRAALLVGDAEHEAEAELLAHRAESLRADLLKVGHHGSRTSTGPSFLQAVSPSLAAISCGVRNRFGHPHPRTLGVLRDHRVPVARTDRGGQIIWETDGEDVVVRRPGDP